MTFLPNTYLDNIKRPFWAYFIGGVLIAWVPAMLLQIVSQSFWATTAAPNPHKPLLLIVCLTPWVETLFMLPVLWLFH